MLLRASKRCARRYVTTRPTFKKGNVNTSSQDTLLPLLVLSLGRGLINLPQLLRAVDLDACESLIGASFSRARRILGRKVACKSKSSSRSKPSACPQGARGKCHADNESTSKYDPDETTDVVDGNDSDDLSQLFSSPILAVAERNNKVILRIANDLSSAIVSDPFRHCHNGSYVAPAKEAADDPDETTDVVDWNDSDDLSRHFSSPILTVVQRNIPAVPRIANCLSSAVVSDHVAPAQETLTEATSSMTLKVGGDGSVRGESLSSIVAARDDSFAFDDTRSDDAFRTEQRTATLLNVVHASHSEVSQPGVTGRFSAFDGSIEAFDGSAIEAFNGSLDAFNGSAIEAFDGGVNERPSPLEALDAACLLDSHVSSPGAGLSPIASLDSVDVSLPAGRDPTRVFDHLTKRMLCGMSGSNILSLWQGSAHFREQVKITLQKGVSCQRRNALDLAGKVPLSLKLLSIGVTNEELLIDFAQAGGLFGTDDGFIYRLKQFLEIKGAKRKRNTKNQFHIKKISVVGTGWMHLFLICRGKEPTEWTDVREYDECDFWLGYVTRDSYMTALQESGRLDVPLVDVTVTPGRSEKSRSWLGKHIKWVKFSDLTLAWWKQHIL